MLGDEPKGRHGASLFYGQLRGRTPDGVGTDAAEPTDVMPARMVTPGMSAPVLFETLPDLKIIKITQPTLC